MTRNAVALTIACFVCLASAGRATVFSFTASGDPASDSDANGNTVNVWTVTQFGNSAHGSLLGNSAGNGNGMSGAGAGNPAWGIFAEIGSQVRARGDIPALVGGSLSSAGESLSLSFDNGFVEMGRDIQVDLYGGPSGTDRVSQLSFTGAGAFYTLFDGSGITSTGVGFTTNGFNLQFSLNNSSGGYSFTIGATTFAGRLLAAGATTITSIEVLNAGAGPAAGSDPTTSHDVYFNNLSIVTVIPEASGALGVGAASAVMAAVARMRRRRHGSADCTG